MTTLALPWKLRSRSARNLKLSCCAVRSKVGVHSSCFACDRENERAQSCNLERVTMLTADCLNADCPVRRPQIMEDAIDSRLPPDYVSFLRQSLW